MNFPVTVVVLSQVRHIGGRDDFVSEVIYFANILCKCVKKIRFVCSHKTQLSAKLSLFLSYNDMFRPTRYLKIIFSDQKTMIINNLELLEMH